MELITGGVTSAKGYSAASASAEIKYKNRDDMALVISEVPAVVAGVFTKNVVKAAPVLWDIDIVKNEKCARAIVLNSGIANASTGKEGIRTNKVMANAVANELGIDIKEVLTASTGVIGMQLEDEKLIKGASLLKNDLASDLEHASKAARAIMTTDTVKKEACVTFKIGDKTVTIGGMTKGSGMIHPNMATMLCVLTSDVSISKDLLQEALSEDVKKSFNMISVDRDTSTNDTYVIFANGKAGNVKITEKNEDYNTFVKALKMVSEKLAKMMAKDGEGATRLLEVKVNNAKTEDEAAILAKSVISSNLVKTAVFGKDANWGRIMCALGYAGVDFDPDKVDLYLESDGVKMQLVEDGMALEYSEEEATKLLSNEEVTIIADMKQKDKNATAWGCDLTYDYVKINGDYRS